MARSFQLTLVTGLVLQAIASGRRYGFDVMDASGLPDGTVYPALRRLEAAGLLSSSWEDPAAAHQAKRPVRRYYELTAAGHHALAAATARYRGLLQALPAGGGPAGNR